MPVFYMFKCAGAGCASTFKGPEAKLGVPGPTLNTSYPSNRAGVACSNAWHKTVTYTGTAVLPPNPPPQPGGNPAPLLPTKWVPLEGGGYASELKYPNIPPNAQEDLIAKLGPILGDETARVALLGASTDRFDDYADAEDDPIAPGLKPAEKFLTLPIVLERLDAVAGAFGPMNLWAQSTIDRPHTLGGKSAKLLLPSGVNGFRFHMELLNDLVNPRGGHAVPAETYAAAIRQSIVLRAANKHNNIQGPNRAFYLYSTSSHRGLSVVHNGANQLLTCYFAGAATAWWNQPLSAADRLERTVA